jgi:hypothetical protein
LLASKIGGQQVIELKEGDIAKLVNAVASIAIAMGDKPSEVTVCGKLAEHIWKLWQELNTRRLK